MPVNNLPDDYSSIIFPKSSVIPHKMKRHREREEILAEIDSDPLTSDTFYSLNKDYREAFLSFCMGNRGLKITYDPFLKNIFSPDRHPERLNMLISAILCQTVTVKCLLSSNHIVLSEKSSLMLMDILVEADDGSLINVEMQKLGYRFPVERAFCYASDIIVRQYDRLKEKLGKSFSYNNIKPVYVIVLMEESPSEFRQNENKYIHKSSMRFDTGLKLNDLIKLIFISLDNFLNTRHNVEKKITVKHESKERMSGFSALSMLDAWLLLLSSDSPGDIYEVLETDPVFGEIYRDIVNFQFHPKELIGMYSETLRLMDQNMIKFMIDEQKEKIEAQNEIIALQTDSLARKDSVISELRRQLEELKSQ